MEAPRPVTIALTSYRALARLLPGSLRGRFGQEMEGLASDVFFEAYGARGLWGLTRAWVNTAWDLLVGMVRERVPGVGALAVANRNRKNDRWKVVDAGTQDLHYALRGIWKNRALSLVMIITLALAIGANTTMVTVVRGVLLRPLPYPNAETLHQVEVYYEDGTRDSYVSAPDFMDYRDRTEALEWAVAFTSWQPPLTSDGAEPRRLAAMLVTEGFFDFLGLQPALGRDFRPEEHVDGSHQVAILSHGLWTSSFGADPRILGTTVHLNDRPHTVVGVGPADFPTGLPGIGRADLWRPFGWSGMPLDSLPGRGNQSLHALARLAPDVSLDQGQAELDALSRDLQRTYPGPSTGKMADLIPLHDFVVEDARSVLFIFLGAVGMVLAIAVSNITSVLLGRAADREREIALRVAMGASRRRILAQLLTESLVLAGLGGVAGVWLATTGTRLVLAWSSGTIPLPSSVAMDLPVLAMTAAIVAVAGVVMGLVPGLSATRRNLYGALKDGGSGRGITATSHGLGMRSWLVVGQVALSLTLLVGAGLLLRSFDRLSRVRTGLDTDAILFRVALTEARYPEWSEHYQFWDQLFARLEQIPGVRDVATVSAAPLTGRSTCGSLAPEEDPRRFEGGDTCAEVRSVTPGYFRTMGVPLVRGRDFDGTETEDSPDVIIINRTAAELLWPGDDPLGKRITTGFSNRWHDVVGVVADVKQFSLDEVTPPQTYLPYRQWRSGNRYVVVRPVADASVLLPRLREAVWAIDPQIAITEMGTFDTLRRRTMADDRFRTVLLVGFAGLALLLAVLGLYGVVSYSVSQRRREVAIRMSLGARADRVLTMVMAHGLRLAALGLMLGLMIAASLTRVLSAIVFDVSTHDPVTFAGVPLVLLLAAVTATWLPARRATRVDPMVVLKS